MGTNRSYLSGDSDCGCIEQGRVSKAITIVVAAEKVNIANMNVSEKPDQQATISITIDIEDLGQLNRVLSRIEDVRGVISVTRAGDGSSIKPATS